jgi:hypothetical protein
MEELLLNNLGPHGVCQDATFDHSNVENGISHFLCIVDFRVVITLTSVSRLTMYTIGDVPEIFNRIGHF